MFAEQQHHRDLVEAILEYEGQNAFDDLVGPWLTRHASLDREWLHALPAAPVASRELCRLYSLSRVLDLMVLGFQPGQGFAGVDCTREQLEEFAEALGMETREPTRWHWFDCELVEVGDGPEGLQEVLWPSLTVNGLLLMRAGCRAAGPWCAQRLQSQPLYWAQRRRHRPTVDLSAGWGGNSQWATTFRRDYQTEDQWLLNVDGIEPLEDRCGWRWELLTQRCALTEDAPDADPWPWDWSATLAR